MARIKRQRNARSHQRMKRRSQNLSIPELIYKFLVEENEAAHDAKRVPAVKCCCGYERLHDEIADSASTRSTGKSMGYRTHKDTGRVSKARGIKRRRISRDLISYLQKCVGVEDTRKARKYMKKALNFGVESGYLIPSDPTYKILRVSSDLMKSDSQKSKTSTCDKTVSKERETPSKLEDLQVQEQRRRRRRRGRRGRRSRSRRSRSPPRRGRGRSRRGRRRRRRRRSRSRTRSRSTGGRSRYSSPQNPEEVAEEMADDYEMDEDDTKGNIHTNGIDREPNSNRSKQSDEEQSKKTEENDSDLSVDEDESDEEGKKRVDTTES